MAIPAKERWEKKSALILALTKGGRKPFARRGKADFGRVQSGLAALLARRFPV